MKPIRRLVVLEVEVGMADVVKAMGCLREEDGARGSMRTEVVSRC